MLIYVYVIMSVIFYLFYKINKNKKNVIKLPPELPQKLPIIGHAHILAGNSLKLYKALEWISYQSIEKGGVITMYIGTKIVYVITDPDDCLTVGNTCLEKDHYFYKFSKDWLGNGLLTGEVPIWKRHRKYLNPAFNQVTLDGFMSVFNKQGRRLVSELYKEVGKGPFKHLEYLSTNSLKTVIQTVFGVNDDITNFHKEYLNSIEQLQIIFTERLQRFWLHSDFIYNMSKMKKRQDTHVEILRKMTDMVIKKRRKYLNEKKFCEETTTKPNKKHLIDFILELDNNGEIWSDKEIREEVTTFIVAGYDTTAFVLTFALLTIGSNPKVQDRIYKELDEVFGDSGNDVKRSDLSRLVYMEAVLNETIRIYPIGPIVARYTNADVQLKNYVVPAGSSIFLMFWGLQRHPIWGPDAGQFNPERWLDRSTLPEKPHAFAGFSIGKRNCIGKNFAMMSMKTTLSYILRRYRIIADLTKLSLKIDVMLKPADGSYISVELRK